MMRSRWLAAVPLFTLGCLDTAAPTPIRLECPAVTPTAGVTNLAVLGCGTIPNRFTAEVAVRGNVAYTTTWGFHQSGAVGNAVNVWNVSGDTPALVDSVIVEGVTGNTGDVAISDDGQYLVVATEGGPGSIVIFDLADPQHPAEITRFSSDETLPGVHTAEVGRVDGTLYAFLAVNPGFSGGTQNPARIVIVSLANPASPQRVYSQFVGQPFLHDAFVRDGILFLALWDGGVQIWDIGGGGQGGTPAAPVVLGGTQTVNGNVHNVWWFHDPTDGSKRYAFIGEEGPAQIPVLSTGDVHVVDVSDMAHPREVAIYRAGASMGTHNFSMDETAGILYAAYYNGGVRALDVRGDLETCTAAEQTVIGTTTLCDLKKMGRELAVGLGSGSPSVFVWGVQYLNGVVYASDMITGIWKLGAAVR